MILKSMTPGSNESAVRTASTLPELRRLLGGSVVFLRVLVVLLVANKPVLGQTCYQFSDAQGGGQSGTYTVKVSVGTIPKPVTAPIVGSFAYQMLTSAAILKASGTYSPLNLATIEVGGTTYTFNLFNIYISYDPGAGGSHLQIAASNFPPSPDGKHATLGVDLSGPAGQGSSKPPNLLPNGLTPVLPAVTSWNTFTAGLVSFDTPVARRFVKSVESCAAAPPAPK